MESFEISSDQARRLRTGGQRLDQPGARTDLEGVVGSVCGVNAQRTSAMLLSLRSRIHGLEASDVDQALLENRSLVRTWAMRGTLHLLRTEDAVWMIPLLGPVFLASGRRRESELGLNDEIMARGLELIPRALAGKGELTRWELVDELAARGLVIERKGQAAVHLVRHAALKGLLCLGRDRPNGEATYASFEEWTGAKLADPDDSHRALLVQRYLAGYGPADLKDFAAWSGLPMAASRKAWKLAGEAGRLTEVNVESRAMWLAELAQAKKMLKPVAPRPVVRLVPAFDSYLLGYAEREMVVAQRYRGDVYHGGQVAPVLLVDGKAAGVWRHERRGKRLHLEVRPFVPLDSEVMDMVRDEAEDVARFLGLPLSQAI